MDHVQNVEEVSAHDVHFVHVDHTWNFVVVSLSPYGFRLWFYTTFSTHNGYRTVEYAQGTFNFYGEVNVARGVDDVNAVVFPVAGGCSGSDSNTTFLLLNHPVHGSATVMGFTNFMVYTGVVQNTLGGGSFTSIDVRHNTDVTSEFQRYVSCHNCPPPIQ